MEKSLELKAVDITKVSDKNHHHRHNTTTILFFESSENYAIDQASEQQSAVRDVDVF